MVRGLNFCVSFIFSWIEERHQLSVIPGLGIIRCGHVERKGLDNAWQQKSFIVSKNLSIDARSESE